MNKKIVFKSRRNRVWRENDIVYKQIMPHPGKSFDPCQIAAFEADMLKKLYNNGVYVPKVISVENNLLAMEYIESVTLTDYIEAAETGAEQIFSDVIVENLVNWFETFYAALQKDDIRGDVNCRNFLIALGGKIAGVDFETSYTGNRETDLGKLIAFILTYAPQHTSYKKYLTDILYRQFLSRFNLDPDLIEEEKNRELNDIMKRRNT